MDDGITAIVIVGMSLGFVGWLVKIRILAKERLEQIRLKARQPAAGIDDNQMGLLRDEIATLRDTSTQHAISLQHSVERLERRIDFLEQKTRVLDTPADARLQVNGRG